MKLRFKSDSVYIVTTRSGKKVAEAKNTLQMQKALNSVPSRRVFCATVSFNQHGRVYVEG